MALSLSSQVWYTLAGGVITELYYPNVDTPQVRDLQFLVTDGATFFHDPKVDYDRQCEPIAGTLGYRLTNTALGAPYSLVHDVIAEPGSPCVLVRTRLQGDPDLLKRLRVYALLAPHLEGAGMGNSGFLAKLRQGPVLVAHRGTTWLAMGADCGFRMTGCGFVGRNDGWQDIIGNRRLPVWTYDSALNGNIALTAEIDLAGRTEFVLAVAFSAGDDTTPRGVLVTMLEALSLPFEVPPGAPAGAYSHLGAFQQGWQRFANTAAAPRPGVTRDDGRLYHLSRRVLIAHEDKFYNGALVASLSIPWGEVNGDSGAGYHMVWPRDMCQSATALLAAGERDLPLRGLMFLSVMQQPDGGWHQNFYITGREHWNGIQLDEYSFPILLAYQLHAAGALESFDPRPMVLAAAGALIAAGPATGQDRWEENGGYSPSTLAANIASLVCAAWFAQQRPEDAATARFLLEYADFLESNVEAWTVTTRGELLPGVPRHYIRILPPADAPWAPDHSPDSALITIANLPGGSRQFPARNIVDAGFLELVRYGIRAPDDPLIRASLQVVDASLEDDLPQGPCWRRYTHDGYGQKDNGDPFDGAGIGRPWPLLTGERAHYELAAGQDVSHFIAAFEAFAGQHGLLAEQLWNAPDVVSGNTRLTRGGPTGSSMPLAWAHSEYLKLVRSVSDGAVFDRIPLVAQRYLTLHAASPLEVWNWNRRIPTMLRGKTLRIQARDRFTIHWSLDGWASVRETQSTTTAVGIDFADVVTDQHTQGPLLFTFYWPSAARWEGVDYQVTLR
jgi:glucoamylase